MERYLNHFQRSRLLYFVVLSFKIFVSNVLDTAAQSWRTSRVSDKITIFKKMGRSLVNLNISSSIKYKRRRFLAIIHVVIQIFQQPIQENNEKSSVDSLQLIDAIICFRRKSTTHFVQIRSVK